MFFTERLLHWVVNAERHVPRDVNLVLIGSALPDEEQRWLRENLDRPFHNIRLGVDDNTTWEFLFATNRQNFGYLDIDCFVLQPKVNAAEMRYHSYEVPTPASFAFVGAAAKNPKVVFAIVGFFDA